jgi:multidrug resistance efflux pump
LEFAKALEAYFERDLFKAESLTLRLNDRRYRLDHDSAQNLLASIDEDLRGLDLEVSKLGLRESDSREQVAIDVQFRPSRGLAALGARLNTKDQAA